MHIIPFSVQTVNVRILDSHIGKVVPITDVAKAIDYDYNSLKGMIERNLVLFEQALVSVTLSSAHNQNSIKGKTYKRVQKFEVKALNHYGVVGLLMKLDYNRIKSEEKKQLVLKFQRWAMQTLGNALELQSNEISDNGFKRTFHGKFMPLTEQDELVTKEKAKEILKRTDRTLRRLVASRRIRKNGAFYSKQDCIDYISSKGELTEDSPYYVDQKSK